MTKPGFKTTEFWVTLASQATSRHLDLAVGRGDGAAVGLFFHPQVARPEEPQGDFVGAIDQLAEKRQPLKRSAQVPPPRERAPSGRPSAPAVPRAAGARRPPAGRRPPGSHPPTLRA